MLPFPKAMNHDKSVEFWGSKLLERWFHRNPSDFCEEKPHISTSVTCESKGNQHSQLEILHFDKGITSKFRSSEAFSGWPIPIKYSHHLTKNGSALQSVLVVHVDHAYSPVVSRIFPTNPSHNIIYIYRLHIYIRIYLFYLYIYMGIVGDPK